jgi:uncharacterized protein with FMN-binding domain
MVGWNVGQQTLASSLASDAPARPANSASSAPKPTSPSSPAAKPAPAPVAPAPAPASGAVDGAYTGSLANTRYGTVQVEVTIAGGKITDVTALKLTDRGGESVSISRQVAPILRGEVLSAQSANVSNVSGGTYTTDGYLTSLQSALDQAHFTG